MTEAQIIKACKAGDPDGFYQLVNKYAGRLFGICLRYMKDEDDAKDVLQEGFIKIFKKIESYKPTGSFEAWLSKVVVNQSLMELRKKKKQFLIIESEILSIDQIDNFDIEIELEEMDILEMLWELPDHYRIILNLAIIEGYSHEEISEMLKINVSTSRTKLGRARKKLQEIYLEKSKVQLYKKTLAKTL